ncbi:MAG: V-type ATP synthase subunit F [Clostridia bacterium]|jgi:V/A-type H+-transporting ATPase subunit F|nr:V-type ATP synthase subunit F [Clostridia bacterium]MCX4367162.1 V-type ATP synthase subunit F [Clostridia bacterium]
MYSNKVAVIGGGDVVLAFKAVGMDVYPASGGEESDALIKKIAKEYAVIFVTEDVAIASRDTVEKYKTKPYPAIIPIPSGVGDSGYAMECIKKNVEKAVGTDILFDRED